MSNQFWLDVAQALRQAEMELEMCNGASLTSLRIIQFPVAKMGNHRKSWEIYGWNQIISKKKGLLGWFSSSKPTFSTQSSNLRRHRSPDRRCWDVESCDSQILCQGLRRHWTEAFEDTKGIPKVTLSRTDVVLKLKLWTVGRERNRHDAPPMICNFPVCFLGPRWWFWTWTAMFLPVYKQGAYLWSCLRGKTRTCWWAWYFGHSKPAMAAEMVHSLMFNPSLANCCLETWWFSILLKSFRTFFDTISFNWLQTTNEVVIVSCLGCAVNSQGTLIAWRPKILTPWIPGAATRLMDGIATPWPAKMTLFLT